MHCVQFATYAHMSVLCGACVKSYAFRLNPSSSNQKKKKTPRAHFSTVCRYFCIVCHRYLNDTLRTFTINIQFVCRRDKWDARSRHDTYLKAENCSFLSGSSEQWEEKKLKRQQQQLKPKRQQQKYNAQTTASNK